MDYSRFSAISRGQEKSIGSLLMLVFSISFLYGKPDPQAASILKKAEKYYASAKALELSFQYEYTAAESKPTVQNGSYRLLGDQFELDLQDQWILYDGLAQYTYLKKNKEIQITAPSIDELNFHPKTLLDYSKNGKFDFRLEGVEKIQNINCNVVDFKPLDKNISLFKIKLFIDSKTNQIKQVKFYEKNGDRITILFKKHNQSKKFTQKDFTFSAAKFPGVHVEDLR